MGPGTNVNNILPPGHEQEYREREMRREMNDRERVREWEIEKAERDRRRDGVPSGSVSVGRGEYLGDERERERDHGVGLGRGRPVLQGGRDSYRGRSPRSRSGSLVRHGSRDEEARAMYYDERDREYERMRVRDEEEDMRMAHRERESESYARGPRGPSDDVDMDEGGYRGERGRSP